MGLLNHPKVDRIHKLIDRFEKGQKFNYLNDINNTVEEFSKSWDESKKKKG